MQKDKLKGVENELGKQFRARLYRTMNVREKKTHYAKVMQLELVGL